MEFAQHLHDDVQIGQDGEGNFNRKRLETSAYSARLKKVVSVKPKKITSRTRRQHKLKEKLGNAVAAKRKTTSYPPKRDRRS